MGRLEGGGAVRREVHTRAALVAAYREGLGLVAITAICIPSGIRIIVAGANDGVLASDDAAMRRWW